MTELVKIFNLILATSFGILVWPFQAVAPLWPMIFVSFVAGILMLWIFGKVSNQDAIKDIRDTIRGNLIGVKLFQHDIGVLLRLQTTILKDTLRYMKHSMVPMVIMIGPVILFMIQLNLYFSVRPLEPGETTVFNVRVQEASALTQGITLEAPEGITIETPPVRIPAQNEVSWRIRADKPGRYAMKVHCADTITEKEIVVGNTWTSVSPLRSQGLVDNLLYPGETPLNPNQTIQSIALNYPELDIMLLGFAINWILLFFVLSIVFGFAFKGFFGIEI
jgi:hypothetical protein